MNEEHTVSNIKSGKVLLMTLVSVSLILSATMIWFSINFYLITPLELLAMRSQISFVMQRVFMMFLTERERNGAIPL